MSIHFNGEVICSLFIQQCSLKRKTCRLTENPLKPIPFEDVLTILVSIFLLFRDEIKGRECVRVTVGEGRKGGGRLLIQTESV